MAQPIIFTILGEPASKANSRQIVVRGGRPASIKSEKALEFERNALRQIPPRYRVRYTGPVAVTLHIFYASERPDLDESIVLDILQDRYETQKLTKAQKEAGMKGERYLVQRGVYVNDRQVREKHVFHGIDRANPRTVVQILPLQPQQVELALPVRVADPLEV
ncbi:RusA family crossover junction endodeoxyribonuclease [Paraburkholderia saeva]|uniref:RusA family crossover junction endodeoxyribonuclease n=1 Tax=Paraburkholderia saeva TaxID=2777537 RepID=UPI001D9CDAA3|nr:RusA family crossover junction endodeoxyribonuclease [Paraburkholderia saeva]CAG4887889.1 hypothetical protein R52603_00532 [Paraburkholderia saeva]